MSKPPIPRPAPLVELEPGEDLAALRRDAERWRWLRERAVRLQGSDIWYQGGYLDLRADVGLGHVREDAQPGDWPALPELIEKPCDLAQNLTERNPRHADD